jgi:hypothetical protein
MIPLRLKTRISYWDLCIVSQLLHFLSTISTKKQSIDRHIIITNWLEFVIERTPSIANTQDSKMQDIQKSLVKGMIPIVQLAEQCCKSKEPLDPVKTRSLLSEH